MLCSASVHQEQHLRVRLLLAQLRTCTGIERGRILHAAAAESGDDRNAKIGSALVRMYSKCGSLCEARMAFDATASPNVVSWTSLIAGYAENGQGLIALQLFSILASSGRFKLDHLVFVAALKACADPGGRQEDLLDCVMGIHSISLRSSSVYVDNALIHAYGKCGCVRAAQRVFEAMAHPDVVSWTSLMLGYAENGEEERALDMLSCIPFSPTAHTFVVSLKACANLAAKEAGKCVRGKLTKVQALHMCIWVESLAWTTGCMGSTHVVNSMVDVYAKCGSMEHACKIFSRIPRPDAVSWNSLIFGYVENGEGMAALHAYACMECAPTCLTYVAALKACAIERRSDVVASVHSTASRLGFGTEPILTNTLIDAYAKCSCMNEARRVFQDLSLGDVVAWNALILGHAENGNGSRALELFSIMNLSPDDITYLAVLKACTFLAAEEALQRVMAIHSQVETTGFGSHDYITNALIDVYGKCQSVGSGRRVFDGRLLNPSLVSWNTVILGYAENGEAKSALERFVCMRAQGCLPDAGTFAAVLKASACEARVELGMALHATTLIYGLEADEMVGTCLINFYGKCGCTLEACRVFDLLEVKHVAAWNALLDGYSRLGDAARVLDLFSQMVDSAGLIPTGVTFLSILACCRAAGLTCRAEEYFAMMQTRYNIRPTLEHYGCMVDLLARANDIDAALEVVKGMPLEPDAAIWTSILGVSRVDIQSYKL